MKLTDAKLFINGEDVGAVTELQITASAGAVGGLPRVPASVEITLTFHPTLGCTACGMTFNDYFQTFRYCAWCRVGRLVPLLSAAGMEILRQKVARAEKHK